MSCPSANVASMSPGCSSGTLWERTCWHSSMGGALTYTSYDALSTSPPLSFPFNSFTSFTLSLTLLPDDIVYQIGDLFDFLFSKPNISTIVLELVSSRGANSQIEEDIDMDATVCPSVTSFHLKVSRFRFPHAARQIFVPMFEALQMPNLQSFHLSLDQRGLDPSVISKLLPNPNGHPSPLVAYSRSTASCIFQPERGHIRNSRHPT